MEESSEHYDWLVLRPSLRQQAIIHCGLISCIGVIKDVERKLIEVDLGETLDLLQNQALRFMDKKADYFMVSRAEFKTFSYVFSFPDVNNEILFKLSMD